MATASAISLEYALATNPLASNTSGLVLDQETIGGNTYLRLTVTKNPAATDVTYTVETTGDLTTPFMGRVDGHGGELVDDAAGPGQRCHHGSGTTVHPSTGTVCRNGKGTVACAQ